MKIVIMFQSTQKMKPCMHTFYMKNVFSVSKVLSFAMQTFMKINL